VALACYRLNIEIGLDPGAGMRRHHVTDRPRRNGEETREERTMRTKYKTYLGVAAIAIAVLSAGSPSAAERPSRHHFVVQHEGSLSS